MFGWHVIHFSPVDVCRADSAEGRELMMCAIKITANQLVLRLFTTITFDFYGNLIYYLFLSIKISNECFILFPPLLMVLCVFSNLKILQSPSSSSNYHVNTNLNLSGWSNASQCFVNAMLCVNMLI